MNKVLEQPPQDRQIWLRAFYGFNPEEAGYLGFTYEPQRESILERMRDGDLVLIYGAVDNLTETALKRQALGFLEVTGERCSDLERSAQSAIDWRAEHGFLERWTFGVKVRRAWRVRNRVHIKTIAPDAYANEHRFERTTRAILLTLTERERALSHTVYQVNVHGEEPIPDRELVGGILSELLKPSRGVPPSLGIRTANYTDGENSLYLMMLDGGSEMLLGRTGTHVGKSLVKIGRSNDPTRRLEEINGGFPERSICRWTLVSSQAFDNASTAHQHEDDLKRLFHQLFTSHGGEFFTAAKHDAANEFTRFCAARIPAIKSAPGKAAGIR